MPSRQEVYAAVDSEREYQNRLWPGQYGESKKHELDAFVLYIAGYTNRLIDKASSTDDVTERLNFVRKVAGLCVACMEQHGAPHR